MDLEIVEFANLEFWIANNVMHILVQSKAFKVINKKHLNSSTNVISSNVYAKIKINFGKSKTHH